MPSHRVAQISEQLRRELGPILAQAIELPPGVLVTVTAVDVAADLQNATVWVSVLPGGDHDHVVRVLQRQARVLHAALFSAVRFRPVPALLFRYDITEAKASDVEALLDRLEQDPAEHP